MLTTLTKQLVQQYLDQGYQFHKMRYDLSWTPDRRWVMENTRGESWEVVVDAEADTLLWRHLRASMLLLRLQEIAVRAGLLNRLDDAELWANAESDAYALYNSEDTAQYGALQDEDLKLFHTMLSDWLASRRIERESDPVDQAVRTVDTISARQGNSMLEALVDPIELEQLVRLFNQQVLPVILQTCNQHRLPVPVHIDVILPHSQVTRAVAYGQELQPDQCQLYLRFYQGGRPDLMLVALDSDIAITLPLEDIVP